MPSETIFAISGFLFIAVLMTEDYAKPEPFVFRTQNHRMLLFMLRAAIGFLAPVLLGAMPRCQAVA